MPALDTTTKAAVTQHFAPAWFIWLDIGTDDLRVTTFGSDVTFSSTGDTDLDGNTFKSFGGSLLDVGDVENSDSGSNTLQVTLSGITSMDLTILNDIGDKTLWQGRTCRIWFQVYDEDGIAVKGGVVPHYTGFMSKVDLSATPKGQTIQLSVENYLAFTTQASNRDYLNQSLYDSADVSAAATIACSNGLRRNSGAVGGVGGGGFGAGLTGGGLGGAYDSLASGGFLSTAFHSL